MSSKQRSPNWTHEELTALVNGYREQMDIFNGKFSPTLTYAIKQSAYEKLTSDINAVSLNGGRTSKQVQKQLSDLKTKVRKKAAEIRRYREATGGGSPQKIALSTNEELLLATMNPQTIDGIIEDGDSALQSNSKSNYDVIDVETITPNIPEPFEVLFVSSPAVNRKTQNKRRISEASSSDSRITSFQADSILEVERAKLDLARNLVALKRIKLSILLKKCESEGMDVSDETKELNNLIP